jgi:catechol 2,3-dioxygenase-like lactoylglutathione lyase family enzyme
LGLEFHIDLSKGGSLILSSLLVCDIDASVLFYTTQLSFKLDFGFVLPDSDQTNAFARAGLGSAP